MQYKFQLNLQKRAALSAAISFWERKEVKDRVTEFFTNTGKLKVDKASSNWHKLTRALLKEWNNNILPPKLKNNLIHIIKDIGEKIFNWYLYIEAQCRVKKTAINYIEKIYWTPYGTVDEIKILKSFWLDNPNLDITTVYNIACNYSLKECIIDLRQKMPKQGLCNCYSHCITCHDQHILQHWQSLKDSDLPEFINCFERSTIDCRNENMSLQYDRYLSPRENLFRLSVHEGYSIAAQQFWQELTGEERNRSVVDCARTAVMRFNDYEYIEGGIGYYKKEKYVEICIFLINQMTINHRELFFNELLMFEAFYYDARDVKGEVLRMLLSVWPWQNLIVPVFNDMMKYLELDCRTVNLFFNVITWKMIEDHKLGYSMENNKYPGILRTVWHELSGSIKQKLSKQLDFRFISDLLEVWDIDSIKLIFNDEKIVSVRDKYIESGQEGYIQLVRNDQYKLLDQLMEETLMSDEEKKILKQQINIWVHFIKADQLHVADKLLDWQCSTVEEKRDLKSSINHIELCECLVQQEQYNLADKFLNWLFETKEERKKCKINFANNVLSIRCVYEIWMKGRRNVDESKKKSDKFLSWLLESEEDIARFKKEKKVNFAWEKFIIAYFIERDLIMIADDFLFWCLLSEVEVQKIKRAIGYKIGFNVCKYNIPIGYVTDAENFIRWAFSKENSRHSFIKKFILSDDGISSCHYFIREVSIFSFDLSEGASRKKMEILKKFIDFWIKPFENINEFRIKFSSYQTDPYFLHDLMYKENCSIFINLLDKLYSNK